MASTQQLKSRIRSVKSTKQITKAMQMVAASKMRRAQESVKASEDYTNAANELLTFFASQGVTDQHPFFQERTVKSRLLIVIAGDKGLAGAYNSNIAKTYINELRDDKSKNVHTKTIAVGRKASQYAVRLNHTDILGVYENLPDKPGTNELRSILDTAILKFESGAVDAVDVIYTKFISGMTQQVTVKRILPAGFDETEVSADVVNAIYEPSAEEVLRGISYRLVLTQIYQAILDARASEHSMRMMAMKNATDNASELADDLTLEMNKARQSAITQELAEISGGVEALSE
ncbi:MAG TPA: ATP synthase F1 subunit gamma [Candidatus Saccharimonadales bacterium]|jgi:F-type H+-transporting ATPase subunit gamma|nr:ATP synthase F1 subunit gamma [Candidatus Saccharimonadales bacterium]